MLLPSCCRGTTEVPDGVKRNASGLHGNFRVAGGVWGVCCCRRAVVERQRSPTERSAMRVACTVIFNQCVARLPKRSGGRLA